MVTQNKIKRLSISLNKLNKATEKRMLRTMERLWIQATPKLHAFNYWYYRYFTSEFELYLLNTIKLEQYGNPT